MSDLRQDESRELLRPWWTFLKVAGLILAVMCGVSLWAWYDLPMDAVARLQATDGATGIVGINLPGINLPGSISYSEEFRQIDKLTALMLVPAIMLGTFLLLTILPFIEPRRQHLLRSMKAFVGMASGLMLVLVSVHAALVASLYGVPIGSAELVLLSSAVLFMVIGNYFGKVQSNWFFGIRTPWTLSSELSWHKTHRAGARFFFMAGIVLIAVTLLPGRQLTAELFTAGLVTGVIGIIIYSWWVWRHDPDRQSSGSHKTDAPSG